MAMLLTGFVGSIIIGTILDKTKKYKLITVINTFILCAAYIAFTFCLSKIGSSAHKVWYILKPEMLYPVLKT